MATKTNKAGDVIVPDDIQATAQNIAERAVLGEGPDIHHMVRGLSNYSNPAEGVFTVDEIDAHVRTWLAAGYKLFAVHHGGSLTSQTSGSQVEKLIYVLLKE